MSKKILIPFALLIIVISALWIRTYHYNEWLFFKWDQARDAILLAPAIKHGPEHLPLLGPRATKIGDDYLRLGPAYYYTQYLTGVIFHSTEPAIFAYSDLFFSIASILLLYLFLRIYFTQGISLLATLLYSFSFLVIQYSRFSWNPNSVPFFTLLTFYGLLRFSIATQFKNKLKWLALWALGFVIASQYHFFAFFVLTGVSGIFFIYYFFQNKKITKKSCTLKQSFIYISTVLIIFGILYTPVIVSDIKTNGSNTKLFFKMFNESGREDKSFSEKLIRNFREQGNNYCLITTSLRHRTGMQADSLTVGFGLFIIISGLLLIKNELRFKKENPAQYNFLILLLIWITVFFVITVPASYQLRPRYFVPVFSIPFIIIALWFSVLEKRIVKYYALFIIFITLIFLGSNAWGIQQWFTEQNDSQTKNFKTYYTLILRHRDGITLNQLQQVTAYLNDISTNQKTAVFYYSSAEYYLPFKYLFYLQNLPKQITPQAVKNIIDLKNKDIIYVVNNGKNESAGKKLRPYLEEISKKQFGQIFVHKMTIVNKQKLDREIQLLEDRDLQKNETQNQDVLSKDKKTERLFWRDIVGTNDNIREILPSKKIEVIKQFKTLDFH